MFDPSYFCDVLWCDIYQFTKLMAGKPKPNMSQVKQILRLHARVKFKTIARTCIGEQNTVKDYIQKAKATNLLMEVLLALRIPKVRRRKLNSWNPAYQGWTWRSDLNPNWFISVRNLKETQVSNLQVLGWNIA